MPDLIAQGPTPSDRWRRSLNSDAKTPIVLGRTSPGWSVPWDDRISRNHARLTWNGQRLEISRLIDSRNPVFYKGLRRDDFSIGVGEHFVIGQTTFSLVDQKIRMLAGSDEPEALTEMIYAPAALRKVRYRDADLRIDALSRLPEIIAGSSSDSELCARVVNVLMQGIPRANLIALVADPNRGATVEKTDSWSEAGPILTAIGDPQGALDGYSHRGGLNSLDSIGSMGEVTESGIRLLHWDSRTTQHSQFTPSARLIRQAVRSRESVLHLWRRPPTNTSGMGPSVSSFTQSEDVDWAFCTPIVSDACPGWAIYAAGDLSSLLGGKVSKDVTQGFDVEIQDDLKFAELTATTLSSLRQMRILQRRQDSLRPFFAPVVQKALSAREPNDVLAPREADVSVLFCDLRGFSRQSEESSNKLLELLRRVSDALGVMTHHILDRNGVVGDFHGDAAMGFWGWPIASKDSVLNAAQAALAIRAEFEATSEIKGHPLAGFRVGIGVATGRAVAGRIGTVDQVKVTVFGPVVNLASRLESMTKQLRAPILVDEATAERLHSIDLSGVARLRKVARVLPAGMATPLMVSELLPPASKENVLEDHHIESYEQALEYLQAGKWDEAFKYLHKVPAEDRVKDFLTVFIGLHGRTPPSDWNGVIKLPEK